MYVALRLGLMLPSLTIFLALLCLGSRSSNFVTASNHDLSRIPGQAISRAASSISSTTSAAQIGLPFGNQHFTPNFTVSGGRRRGKHVKRTLDFQGALCKGDMLWKMLVEKYDGAVAASNSPSNDARSFTKEDIANGWSFYRWLQPPPIGANWDKTFRDIAGGRTNGQLNPERISIIQDKMFRNKFGTFVRVSLFSANSYCLYAMCTIENEFCGSLRCLLAGCNQAFDTSSGSGW